MRPKIRPAVRRLGHRGAMSEPRVLVAVADHVATVTLNRPEKRNGLDGPFFAAIVEAALSGPSASRGEGADVSCGAS